MLYFNLLNGGGQEQLKRITYKGNVFLVPLDYESREPDFNKQIEKKIFAYLRLPPITPDVRSKLLTVKTGVETWQIALTANDQACHVAVTGSYPPSLAFTIMHFGDVVTDPEQFGSYIGPNNELIINQWSWNLMSTSASAISTLLDPVQVQSDLVSGMPQVFESFSPNMPLEHQLEENRMVSERHEESRYRDLLLEVPAVQQESEENDGFANESSDDSERPRSTPIEPAEDQTDAGSKGVQSNEEKDPVSEKWV